MKVNEIKDYVNQVAHECSNSSYFACIGNDESRFKAMYTVDSLVMLARTLDLNLTIVNDKYCHYAVVYAPIGKNKLYFRWVTACNKGVDNSTYDEFKKVITNYFNNGYECYTTNGEGGMTKLYNVNAL